MKDLYVIFGPQGSAKTGIAELLAKQLDLDHISWGSLFRDAKVRAKNKSQFSKIDDRKTPSLERAKIISDLIASEMKLLAPGVGRGLILEGYPRQIEEAKQLLGLVYKFGYHIKTLIQINPSMEVVLKRVKARLVCVVCGRYYEGGTEMHKMCPRDGGKLSSIRSNTASIREDFFFYSESIKEVVKLLQSHSDSYFNVSGNDEKIVVFSNILQKIKKGVKDHVRIFIPQSSAAVETKYGVFKMISYQSQIDYQFHLALVKGNVSGARGLPIRVHSSCITGDIFHSRHCDCGEQLAMSMKKVEHLKRGIIVYLFQEGRGINIINKLRAYSLQGRGLDTVEANEDLNLPAEMRTYDAVKDILVDLDVKSISLMTNNPDKIDKLIDLGIMIENILPIEIIPNKTNARYLLVKKKKMNHRLVKT